MTQPRRPQDRPLVRRDAEGTQRTARSWETLTERLIREAQEDGAFDELPGQGRPLRPDDDRYAGDKALAYHVLRNAGAAPPWIEADKQVRAQLDAIERLISRARHSPAVARERLERDLERLADDHDDAVARLEGLAPTAQQQRPRLDRERARARLLEMLGSGIASR